MSAELDAVVVGSGPNGLAAAVVLCAAGLAVGVYEMGPTLGGGCRTEELTLPGFHHDVCSAGHPLAIASGFFRRFDLASRGVRLLQPEVAFAHPLDGGRAGAVMASLDDTAAGLGEDAEAWRHLFRPLLQHHPAITDAVLSSMRAVPPQPVAVGRFGLLAVRSAAAIAGRFSGDEARGLFAGVAAHGMMALDRPVTGGVGLLLSMLAQAVGFPLVEGGSAGLVSAMVEAIEQRGGEVRTGERVTSLAQLPPAEAVLLDVTPRALVELAGDRLPPRQRRRAERFRYGPGVCKVDWALAGPVPWEADACRRAGTVHLGGTFEEVAASEAEVAAGRHSERPYVLTMQPSVIDATRAPKGKHTLWAYCHVPAGSTLDRSEVIARQIDRFAPGWRDLVLASSVRTAAEMAEHDPNYVGGDIGSGTQDLRQTFARPAATWNPYRTGIPGVYLCSSSTPPGPGVHGRCGELAALSVLREVFGLKRPPGIGPIERP
ncbi:MAG: NAD(P)/FAD-dependent oxidoreductase [Acidimicrobiales bacterium]|jgi:phytoene dehydrogenase-like protein